jgi:Fe2+ transport system protein FeoA
MQVEKIQEPLPLDMLRDGEEACIVEVTGCPLRVHQLAEMGMHRGCKVQMIRPGQPCMLAVDGRRFSLRLDPDTCILVNPTNDQQAGQV